MEKIGNLRWVLLVFALGAFNLCINSPLWAGVVTGEIDKAEGTLEDQFTYTVTVQGSFDGEPEMPAIEGLVSERSGTSQNVSIVNGHFSRETQYQFTITPQREGTFEIPAIKLKIDGNWQQTLPLTIKVKASAALSAEDRSDQPVFIEREFSKTKLYVGETISVRIRIFNKVKLYGATPEIVYPDGFQVRSIEEQKNYSQTIQGEEYGVIELVALLTPQKPGRFDVAPAILTAKIGSGRRRSRSMIDDWINPTQVVQKRFRSPPATLDVMNLPVEGRRADFTGLVGDFNLSADVSPRSIKVGETSTLTLTIKGSGPTTGMADPDFKWGDKVKIYKDKPQSLDAVDAAEGIKGERVLKFALVPTQAGALELGSVGMQYFNATTGNYQDLTAELGTIQVEGQALQSDIKAASPPPTSAVPAAEPRDVQKLGEDLIEPHAIAQLGDVQVVTPMEWAGGGATSILSLGFLLFSFWQKQRNANASERMARRRASEAGKKLQKELTALGQVDQGNNRRAQLRSAQHAWKAYFSDKFAMKASTMTLAELEAQLAPHLKDPSSLQAVRDLWKNYERLLFAATAPADHEAHELIETTKRVMQEIDKRC